MSQTVKQTSFGTAAGGEAVSLFRIPNSTDDYIEVTNYGCTIRGLYVHNRQGVLENLVCGLDTLGDYEAVAANPGALFGGALGGALSHKVWDVADVGDNYVFFACECPKEESGCGCGIKAGARIMWVNLNRLVIDLFLTPEKAVSLPLSSRLTLRGGTFSVRSFCPTVRRDGAELPVEETPYAGLQFCPVGQDTFLCPQEDIKPMAELVNDAAGMHVSAYATLSALRTEVGIGEVCLVQETSGPVSLQGGESFAARVIYGIDYLRPQEEDNGEEPNPFSAFVTGL